MCSVGPLEAAAHLASSSPPELLSGTQPPPGSFSPASVNQESRVPWQAREPGRKAISLIRLVRPLCAGVSVNGPLIGLQTLLHFNRKRGAEKPGGEGGRAPRVTVGSFCGPAAPAQPNEASFVLFFF